MYVIAIAWLYVALMLAVTSGSLLRGIFSFIFFGLAPLSLVLWLFGTPARRRARQKAAEAPNDNQENDVRQ